VIDSNESSFFPKEKSKVVPEKIEPTLAGCISCPVCRRERGINMQFVIQSDLNRHIKAHHLGSTEAMKIIQYEIDNDIREGDKEMQYEIKQFWRELDEETKAKRGDKWWEHGVVL